MHIPPSDSSSQCSKQVLSPVWWMVMVFTCFASKTLSIGKYGILMASLHQKCAVGLYPKTEVQRSVKHVDWAIPDEGYSPIDYTAPSILKQPPYADKLPDAADFSPAWNALDGQVDRRSHEAPYAIVDGLPRNPHGRTGVRGRGLLGRWGPNHAADPIVTRWKRSPTGDKIMNESSGLPVLEFVCILRGDGGGWAIPGGMVDPGEVVSATLRREFLEEALNANDLSPEERQLRTQQISELFNKGVEVFSGYVDDPRNTDNAWMETVAQNFHCHAYDDDPGRTLVLRSRCQ
ncbi:ADP-ribose pyrophosphatase, mitochondrial-like [Hyalella azteca]|uniref:ADP-ribose pyrophosphatase, mitochondrial-like n=1 Tax=Hyalella azteca TaxID=294128 RepID=A0A8B7NZB6_HYAAZ|nr:ADP-ribose pyrophosphatase, mitochondrial-like [Hyalella azteca]